MKAANDNDSGKIPPMAPSTSRVLDLCLNRRAIAIDRAPQGGEVYLPIVERLGAEIEAKKASESTVARALRRIRR